MEVARQEIQELFRNQERLERRIERLQRSLDSLRSDVIRVILAVGKPVTTSA
jgi:prefoldin subunit 5